MISTVIKHNIFFLLTIVFLSVVYKVQLGNVYKVQLGNFSLMLETSQSTMKGCEIYIYTYSVPQAFEQGGVIIPCLSIRPLSRGGCYTTTIHALYHRPLSRRGCYITPILSRYLITLSREMPVSCHSCGYNCSLGVFCLISRTASTYMQSPNTKGIRRNSYVKILGIIFQFN